MPYNSYFQTSYPQLYPQVYPQGGQQQPSMSYPQAGASYPQNNPQAQAGQPMSSNLIWVQGEAGAKSYLVAPNTTVQLWDSERQTIYLKSADASGMPSIKTLDYTIRESTPNNTPLVQADTGAAFATKAELTSLAQQVEALKSALQGLSGHSGAVENGGADK